MKKMLFSALVLGTVLGLTGCSSDEPDVPVQGDGATFTIRLPKDMQTRSTFGDQSKVTLNNLQWTIYDVTSGTATLVTSGAKANAFATSQTEEQVTLPLVKGRTYQVTFYADNSQNNYASYTDGKVNINYANGASNDREEDCFVGKSTQIAVTGAFNETVTLTRPYSQINWGTDDLGEATVKAVLTGLLANVKVSNLYQTMDVLTDEFSNPVTGDITFPNVDMNKLPAETFPVEGYTLIAMNYLLTGNGTVDCSLNFNNNVQSVVVNQAPVKVNYRTNIYGSLLTSPGNFNIIVDPSWEEPDINVAEAKTEAAFVAALANPAVKTVNVTANLDLSQATPEQLTFNTPKTINVASGKTLQLGGTNPLTSNDDLTISGGGTITNGGTPSTPGVAKILIKANKGVLTLNNVTLVNDTNHHYHGAADNCSAITYMDSVTAVNIDNVTVNSGEFTLCGMGRDTNKAVVTINNSNFISTSSSQNNGVNWSYAIRLFGSTGTMNNCVVKGIQGALSVEKISLTINGGKYYTYNSPGKVDAFYAIYATNNGQAIINDGEFWGPNKRTSLDIGGTSCLVSGDNDTGRPLGTFVIKGGKMSGKAYNSISNTIIDPADGFMYSPLTGQSPLAWRVVAKSK